ncbi:hypothetical protein RFI_21488, partial [Reticulomyxa filosa]
KKKKKKKKKDGEAQKTKSLISSYSLPSITFLNTAKIKSSLNPNPLRTPPTALQTQKFENFFFFFQKKKKKKKKGVETPSLCGVGGGGEKKDEKERKECTHWEVKDVEVTHLAFDKDEHIYFTNGEEIYKIGYATDVVGAYSSTYTRIWSPGSDTIHVTSLWRQADTVYFTVQDWNKEEDIVLYRIRKVGVDVFGRKDSSGSITGIYRARSPTDSNLPSLVTQISRSAGGYSTPTGMGGTMTFPDINGPLSVVPANSATSVSNTSILPNVNVRTGGGANAGTSSPTGGGGGGGAPPTDAQKVRAYALRYKQRVWQLRTLRFEKKFLVGVAASHIEQEPAIMNIAFKKELQAY